MRWPAGLRTCEQVIRGVALHVGKQPVLRIVPRSADFAGVVDSLAQGVDVYGSFLSRGQSFYGQLALATKSHEAAATHLRHGYLGLAREILIAHCNESGE